MQITPFNKNDDVLKCNMDPTRNVYMSKLVDREQRHIDNTRTSGKSYSEVVNFDKFLNKMKFYDLYLDKPQFGYWGHFEIPEGNKVGLVKKFVYPSINSPLKK